ncbi:MAG: lysine--tRNA ligase [Candidatus Aenigmarchaeota archaeon]|nr:lysine--tRNA ligase [Candidatus Aenigmarchaeota archaeon]
MVSQEKPIFWADQIAKQAIERAKKEKNIVTCRSGASPSGAKHIGNLFDVAKSWFVHKAVLKQGYQSRFVLTNDNRDPLRKIPDKLPGLDGKIHELTKEEKKKLEKHLGYSYVDVPDPFGCCKSWAEHFGRVWLDGILALGIEPEVYDNDSLYLQGKFDPYIRMVVENIDKVRKIMSRFQRKVDENYIPMFVKCEKCGKMTATPVEIDLENWIVKYECRDVVLSSKYKVKGCGHKGETSLDNVKLAWRFEWPAQWAIFNTTFEPFGKEHYEGSWQSGQVIAREIYGIEPPISHVYEFLLINGKKMSASIGNIYITQQMLEILEPEVFLFFYTKKSKKQRDLDLKHINRLVNDFDLAERVYFGVEKVKNEKEKVNWIRMYESAVKQISDHLPVRIPYRLAGLIVNVYQNKLWDEEFVVDTSIELMKRTSLGNIYKTIESEDKKCIYNRLLLVKNWIERFAPEMKITLNEKAPKLVVEDDEIKALEKFSKILGEAESEDELYEKIYSICKDYEMKPQRFFSLLYKILIGKEQGPRLATFVFTVGKEKVKKLLDDALSR